MANENALFILNLLQNGEDSSRELQLTALEQLCLFILQMDTTDSLKKEYPPSSFIPVLVKLFVEFDSPPPILESASRVLTYYTQLLPLETATCLLDIEGALCAICIHLENSDLNSPVESDLAQQIIKLLEELVRRDSNVYKLTTCIPSVFEFISSSWRQIHLDTLRSGLFVIGRLANLLDIWLKGESSVFSSSKRSSSSTPPALLCLQHWVVSLVQLISHRDLQASCGALDCLYTIFTACRRLPSCLMILNSITSTDNLIDKFLSLLVPSDQLLDENTCTENLCSKSEVSKPEDVSVSDEGARNPGECPNEAQKTCANSERVHLTGQLALVVVDLILNLCQGQANLLHKISNSQELVDLFQYALQISGSHHRSSESKNPGTTNVSDKTSILLPTLHLAEGLLNLAMVTTCYSDGGDSKLKPQHVDFADVLDKKELDLSDACEDTVVQSAKSVPPQHSADNSRKIWKCCLASRPIGPKQMDYGVISANSVQSRPGLPRLPSFTSSSSSVSNQSQSTLLTAGFSAARQGFDHLGIADDRGLASDRFHHWLAQSLGNHTNMADIYSILHSGQISSTWMDSAGQPLLAWSLKSGHGAATVALCQRGADVNAGLVGSALHYAITRGQLQCVKMLLGVGYPKTMQRMETSVANPRLRDCHGRTPTQLATLAMVAAMTRGRHTERYRTQLKIVQKAEEEFKAKLAVKKSTPFAKLLRLALPVLTEVYTTSTKFDIRLRALQIICQCVRSKTGFAVLYQMQKPSVGSLDRREAKTVSPNSSAFCNSFVKMIASAISQGSAEEVMLTLAMIPALIDQPYFLTWMHRHGIPQLLAWRSGLYGKDQSSTTDLPDSTEHSPEFAEINAFEQQNYVRGIPRDNVIMCLPDTFVRPQIIGLDPEEICPAFQCIHEIGRNQAYVFVDWNILRVDDQTLLVFHEFGFLWIEATEKVKQDEPADDPCMFYDMVVYWVTRKDKSMPAESNEQEATAGTTTVASVAPLPTLNVSSNLQPTTLDNVPANASNVIPLVQSNTDDPTSGLIVQQLMFDSPPVDRSELAHDLWAKALPLMIKVRHMFYGMLPLPISKTSSPLRSNSLYKRKLKGSRQNTLTKTPGKFQNLSIPMVAPPQDSLTLPSAPNIFSRLCAVGSSAADQPPDNEYLAQGLQPADNSSPSTRDQTTPGGSPSSTQFPGLPPLQKHSPSSDNNPVDQGNEPCCTTCLPMQSTPGREYTTNLIPENGILTTEQNAVSVTLSSEASSHIPLLKISSKAVQDTTSGSGGADPNCFPALRKAHSKSSHADSPSRSIYYTAREGLACADPAEVDGCSTRTAGCSTSPAHDSTDNDGCYCCRTVHSSGKITCLYAGAIRISYSHQGLWFSLDPKLRLSSLPYRSFSTGEKPLFCTHSECESRWNPDFSDDENDYNEPNPYSPDFLKNYTDSVRKSKKIPSPLSPNFMSTPKKVSPNFSDTAGSKLPSSSSPINYKFKVANILCHPTRLGGIRVYGTATQPVHQSGSLARNLGNLRLSRLLDNLTFNQRLYSKTKHKEVRLNNVRKTISRVGLIISELLVRLMARKLHGPSPRDSLPKVSVFPYQSTTASDLSVFAESLNRICLQSSPQKKRAVDEEPVIDAKQLLVCFEKATPYELMISKIIPALKKWIKIQMQRVQSLNAVTASNGPANQPITSAEYVLLSTVLNRSNIKLIAKKLVSTLELVERYPLPPTHIVGLPEQLLTRTVQLKPQLLPQPPSDMVVSKDATYARKVDLFNHHLYVQPLVTVRQLQEWILKATRQIPWYNDELKSMGFVYDMRQPPFCVHLTPSVLLTNSEKPADLDITEPNTYQGGVFAWLGTNGGREKKWANPLRLHGLVRVCSSDSDLNHNPRLIGSILMNPSIAGRKSSVFRHNRPIGPTRTSSCGKSRHCRTNVRGPSAKSGVFIRPSETEPFPGHMTAWIAFDLGMHIQLTHYFIQVSGCQNRWPALTDWQLQGSTNGIEWTVLAEHHIKPVGNPLRYWGNEMQKLWKLENSTPGGNAQVWRFLRIHALNSPEKNGLFLESKQNSVEGTHSRPNKMVIRGVEFFGTVMKLLITQDKEAQKEAHSYLEKLRPGAYVVPNLPVTRNDPKCASLTPDMCLYEEWPPCDPKPNELGNDASDLPSVDNADPVTPQSELQRPPLLGVAVTDLVDGRVSVRWFDSFPVNGAYEMQDQQTDSEVSHTLSVYVMGIDGRYDLRIPSEKELQIRMEQLRSQVIGNGDKQGLSAETSQQQAEGSLVGQNVEQGQCAGPSVVPSKDYVLISQPQSVTSYLLPMSHNWLADALLPTFSRVMPFLFASFSPQLLRDPPVIRHQSSSYTGSSASQLQLSAQDTSNRPLVTLASRITSPNWEDALSNSTDELVERQATAQSPSPLIPEDNPIAGGLIKRDSNTPQNEVSCQINQNDKMRVKEDKKHGHAKTSTQLSGIPVSTSALSSVIPSFPMPNSVSRSVSRPEDSLIPEHWSDLCGMSTFDIDNENEIERCTMVNDEADEEEDLDEEAEDECPQLVRFQAPETKGYDEKIDTELEAIGRTLELRILANAAEGGIRTHSFDSARLPVDPPPRARHHSRAKFDNWERSDPIDVDTVIKQCLHLSVISTEHVYCCTPRSSPCHAEAKNDPGLPCCSNIPSPPPLPKKCAKTYPTESGLSCGASTQKEQGNLMLWNQLRSMVSNKNTPNACQRFPKRQTDTALPTLLSPPPTTVLCTPKDYHLVPQNRPTNRPLSRYNLRESIVVESIDASLPGLIPPFDTRATSSPQPSTVPFTIPETVSLPFMGHRTELPSTNCKSPVDCSSPNGVFRLIARIWLSQEISSDPPGFIMGPPLPPPMSHSSSASNTVSTVTVRPVSNEAPVNPLETEQFQAKAQSGQIIKGAQSPSGIPLTHPDIYLIHYLLNNAEYSEEFPGSGVLKPVGSQLNRMWNRTYMLEYTLGNVAWDESFVINSGERDKSMFVEFEDGSHHLQFADCKFRDQLLELLSLLHDSVSHCIALASRTVISGSCYPLANESGKVKRKDNGGTDFTVALNNAIRSYLPEDDNERFDDVLSAFHSPRLTRKLMVYAHDIWSVLRNSHIMHGACQVNKEEVVLENSQWVMGFSTRHKFLFPFEARLEFWHVSGLGASRAIAWLQKYFTNAKGPSNHHTMVAGMQSVVQRPDLNLTVQRDRTAGRSFAWVPSYVIGPAHRNSSPNESTFNDLSTSGASRTNGSKTTNFPMIFPGVCTTINFSGSTFGPGTQMTLNCLGRLQRHMARVPRPQVGVVRETLEPEEKDKQSPFLTTDDHSLSAFGGGNSFWCSAVKLLSAHADKQQELEIEFEGEEGTGLGPTMEFYALLSSELRRHCHGMWVSDDRAIDAVKHVDADQLASESSATSNSGFGAAVERDGCQLNRYMNYSKQKETEATDTKGDFHVNPPMGLFPAPWPGDQLPPGTELRFYILGIALAKCLLDQRQMDLPLSNAFLCLLCEAERPGSSTENSMGTSVSANWPSGVLDMRHFQEIYPERGIFLRDLCDYLAERAALQKKYTGEQFHEADIKLQIQMFSAELGSLCLDMSFAPATRRFGQTEFPLADHYSWEDDHGTEQQERQQASEANILKPESEEIEMLTVKNIGCYVKRSVEFAMSKGISKQMRAFRAGFERVIPLRSLSMFTPRELGRLIFGESSPAWSAEEIWAFCEPAAGYTRQSRGFLMLVDALASFDPIERRAFLRFVTGCPTLPPGGLRNLHPRLKVAKKDGTTCGPFPSVNTCMHYLKLPEYGCSDELKKHLLAAASQKGFYLN
ncbi:unnamed protein product [Calicophoron daubneyi]|uniref:E3 ubiquitin-protein ligase n=1 Tax=Calicophoron daubneyi TaxID=300641 RepID=A0AAV2TRT8_CALDB